MESRRLASQLRRSYEGEAWHGPDLRKLLSDVAADHAAAKPVRGAHSIWELVLHVTAWEREALAMLGGKAHETLTGENDWPPVREISEARWQSALTDLETVTRDLVAAVRAMPDERLNDDVTGAQCNFYFLLHGVVQHNLYHAGQIALLKRAQV